MTREETKRCVGEGWSKLIDELFDRLPKGAAIHCVKEKYGGLRIDGYGPDAFMDLMIELERKSETICEECGKPGELRDLNWIRTLCEEHYKLRKILGGSVA